MFSCKVIIATLAYTLATTTAVMPVKHVQIHGNVIIKIVIIVLNQINTVNILARD